ncbi:MAG: hypothetical protein ACREB6_14890, partial [Rhodospirillales bacterium]
MPSWAAPIADAASPVAAAGGRRVRRQAITQVVSPSLPHRPDLVRNSSATRPKLVRNSSKTRPKLVISSRRFSPNQLIRHDSRPGKFPKNRHLSSFLIISGFPRLNV